MSDINQDDYDSFDGYVDALEATITEQAEVIARLASEELFVPPIQVSKTFGVKTNWVKEWDARIAYANAALEKT